MGFPVAPIDVTLRVSETPRAALQRLLGSIEACLEGTGRMVDANFQSLTVTVRINTPGPGGTDYDRVVWTTVELLLGNWERAVGNGSVSVHPRVQTASTVVRKHDFIPAVDPFDTVDLDELEEAVIQCLEAQR